MWGLEYGFVVAILGEFTMLNIARPAQVGLVFVFLVAVAACGTQTEVRGTASATPTSKSPHAEATADAGDCAYAAQDPQVLGDQQAVSLARTVDTTLGDLGRWLDQRAKDGAPVVDAGSRLGLDDVSADAPVTVCVFRVEPRPIPVPPDVSTVADGIRVLVQKQKPDVYAIDAMGDLDRLTKQLDTLSPGAG